MDRLHLNRATVAGVGTTATLVAAIIAVSLMVGGLVAYTASPGGPLVSGQPSLALPQTGGGGAVTASSRPLRLPKATRRATATAARTAARAAAPTAGRAPAATAATKVVQPGGTTPNSRRTPAFADTKAPPAKGTPAAGTGLGKVTEPARQVAEDLAKTTTVAGGGLGTAVEQTTSGLNKITAPLAPALGPVLDAVGHGAAALVNATTGVLADVIRRLGGGH